MTVVAVRDVVVVVVVVLNVVIIILVFILTFGRADDVVQVLQQQTQPHRGFPADIYYTLGREVIGLLFFLVLTFVDLFFGCCAGESKSQKPAHHVSQTKICERR